MSFKILFVAATSTEAVAIEKILGSTLPETYMVNIVVAGVGSVSTAWEMQKWISVNTKPDLAINLGIAGSFSNEIPVGAVVMPYTDCFADAGIEDGEEFMTLAEAGLTGSSEFPFVNGQIPADPHYINLMNSILRPVRAITVNTATGSEGTREKLIGKFNPEIETMEGATFFYICSREKIPFIALRAISNMVERRDKSKWNIELALKNLSEKLVDVILKLK
jgi:futalosine hydrolase